MSPHLRRGERARLTRDADSRYGERAKRARLTRDADSRCTLAGGPQPLSIFVVMLQCVSRRELQPLLSSVARDEGTTPQSQL